MNKQTKWSPSHFPRGTVIKTQLFRKDENGNLIQQCSLNEIGDVELTVDHVKRVRSFFGITYHIVTTAKNDKPMYDGDKFIRFNIDHVNEIVRVGNKLVIKSDTGTTFTAPTYFVIGNKKYVMQYELPSLVGKLCLNIRQDKMLKIDEMVTALYKVGVFKPIKSDHISYSVYSAVNNKRLKKWLKQNINRFIYSNKELDKHRETIENDLLYSLEKDFDEQSETSLN